jgi:hypothetical protein
MRNLKWRGWNRVVILATTLMMVIYLAVILVVNGLGFRPFF